MRSHKAEQRARISAKALWRQRTRFVAYTCDTMGGFLAVSGYRVQIDGSGTVTDVGGTSPEWRRSDLLAEAVFLSRDPFVGSRLPVAEMVAAFSWRS